MEIPARIIPVPGGTAACSKPIPSSHHRSIAVTRSVLPFKRGKNLNRHYLFHTILLMYQPEAVQ